jgi:hypothetical protein
MVLPGVSDAIQGLIKAAYKGGSRRGRWNWCICGPARSTAARPASIQVSECEADATAVHYDEQGMAALILWIATTNLFNRLNSSIKEQSGATWG